MIKKIQIVTVLMVPIFLLLSATLQRSSSGAPASHTGAPEDKTCATSGCHDDHPINSGSAKMSLVLDNDISAIAPGQTYTLRFSIHDKNVSRFGFQLLALQGKSNQNSGTFIIIDSLRTQLIQNRYALKERQYVTYTFNGTDAVSTGLGEWSVKWQAPSDLDGPVTFYYGAVSANDDMSDKGDKSYSGSLMVKNIQL
jgi:hypothetical protein